MTNLCFTARIRLSVILIMIIIIILIIILEGRQCIHSSHWVLLCRSSVKLYSQPNALFSQSNNPLSFLGPVLFPPGTSNAPVDQLQHFFGGGFAPDKRVTESQNLIALEAARSASESQGRWMNGLIDWFIDWFVWLIGGDTIVDNCLIVCY